MSQAWFENTRLANKQNTKPRLIYDINHARSGIKLENPALLSTARYGPTDRAQHLRPHGPHTKRLPALARVRDDQRVSVTMEHIMDLYEPHLVHDFVRKYKTESGFLGADFIQENADSILLLLGEFDWLPFDISRIEELINDKDWKKACNLVIAAVLVVGVYLITRPSDRKRKLLIISLLGAFLAGTSDFSDLVKKVREFDYKQARGDLNAILDGKIVQDMNSALLSLVSLSFFPKDYSDLISKWLNLKGDTSVRDTFENLLKAVQHLLNLGVSAARGAPLKPLFMEGNPVSVVIKQLEHVLSYKDRITTGIPIEGYMTLVDYSTELDRLYADLIDVKILKLSKRQKSAVEKGMADIVRERAILASTFQARERTMPFAIVIHGAPGIGKSSVTTFCGRVWADVNGRVYHQSHVFTRGTGEYWEGYIPTSHYILHYSEPGAMLPAMAKLKGDPIVQELTSVVDSLPFAPNMAFEMKGKVFANPELVLIDTNNQFMNLDVMFSNPAAYKRRFLYIHPIVKPQYANAGGSLNVDDSLDDGSFIMDRWTFKVTVEEPHGVKDSVERVLLSGGPDDDIYALNMLLRKLYRKHIDSQNRVQKATDFDMSQLSNVTAKTESGIMQYVQDCWSHSDCNFIFIACFFISFFLSLQVGPLNVILFACSFLFFTILSDRLQHRNDRGGRGRPLTVEQLMDMGIEIHYQPRPRKCPRTEAGWFETNLPNPRNVMRSASDFKKGITFFISVMCVIGRLRSVPPFVMGSFTASVLGLLKYDVLSQIGSISLCTFICTLFYILGVVDVKIQIGEECVVSSGELNIEQILRDSESLDSEEKHGDTGIRNWLNIDKYLVKPDVSDSTMDNIMLASKVAASIGVVIALWKLSAPLRKSTSRRPKTEAKVYSTQNPVRSLSEYEEMLGCGKSIKRVRIKGTNTWNLQQVPFSHKGVDNKESSLNKIRGNSRCFRRLQDGNKYAIQHVLGLRSSLALINRHAFVFINGKCDFEITRTVGDFQASKDWIKYSVTPGDLIDVASDIVAIRLEGIIFHDISHLFVPKQFSHENVSGFLGSREVRLSFSQYPISVDSPQGINKHTSYWCAKVPDRPEGMCGLPYVADFGGVYRVIALHFAGADDDAFGDPIYDSCLPKKSAIHFESSLGPIDVPDLTYPVNKSPLRYEEFPFVEYMGKLPGHVLIRGKSRVKPSPAMPIASCIRDELMGSYERYGPPPMAPFVRDDEYFSPYNIALRKISDKKYTLDKKILDKIVNRYADHIIDGLRAKGFTKMSPLDMHTALNGDPDDAYLRSMNFSTSAGHDWHCIKKELVEIEEDPCFTRKSRPELEACVVSCLERYTNGQTCNYVYDACLKDEPRLLSKNREGKTRLFYISPIEGVVIARMFLSPFYTAMVQYGECFGTAVGVNMFEDAGELSNRMLSFSEYIMEGDYSSFDQTIPFDISHAAARVTYKVLKAFGYSDQALKIVDGILTDALFPVINVKKDLFRAPGLQPSGKYGTAEDNSLKDNLSLMYCWYSIPELQDHDFFECVKPLTYGDDVLAAIKKEFIKYMNNIVYANFCRTHYGMKFTPALKGAVMQEFLPWNEVSFLKRNFVIRDGKFIAPLFVDSIVKSLEWYIPSSYESEEVQILSTVSSAFYELRLHLSKREFNSLRDKAIVFLREQYPQLEHRRVCNMLPLYEDEEREVDCTQ